MKKHAQPADKIAKAKDLENADKITLESFDLGEAISQIKSKPEMRSLSFWVPVEYRAKFNKIQCETDKKFGKYLLRVITKLIDNVELENKV